MSREALERKKGLDHEWGERGVERRPLTAEGINTELPLPCWGFVTWCKGGEWRNTRERELPLFLNPWLRPRSWLSLMKTSKTLADSHTHTHTCRKSLVAQSGVTTEVDEDVKSLTAAIRLGGSETREERQQRECEMWTAEEVEWKQSLLVFSLSAGLLFLCRPNLLNSAQCLGGLECFCVRACLHVCSLHPERFHGCASFQRTCSVSSTAESSWTERGRGRDGNTEREMIERASGW